MVLHNTLLEIDGYDEMWRPEDMSTEPGREYFSLNRLQNPDLEARPIERRSKPSHPSTTSTITNSDAVINVCEL